ncbi:MAG: RecQ family ATP-dependent DNA helicase [Bacteroidota bacterium]|nr:RecQ family ATP-dependent DNA helicase [Bacteroidota bacterium]
MKEPVGILKEYWGYDAFRPFQQDIINSILSGNDTLALMPTGGGKSVCFQVPAMMQEGLCLVITPLIALMKDQVSNLRKRGIPALSVYSGMGYAEVIKTLKNATYGNFKFLYVSPERLETELFLEYLPLIKINLIAVDEAHCISQWGYDFRPSYLKIAAIRSSLKHIPILALTASATLEVQNDICDKLAFNENHQRFQQSFERSNLSYSVFNPSSKQNKLIDILKKVNGSGIVYCKSRRRTREVEELLKLNGIKAGHYHAGLSNDERNIKQEEWINNKIRIIACTNAFGMGIDKPDVRTVIHYDVPDALENYYQEAGRAGRDGKKAYAVLFFNETELSDLQKQAAIRFPDLATIKIAYNSLVNYFQLPSGSGEEISFDFDISDFVKKFKLDAFTVNSVLKILEQEEIINYSEQFFSPSTVVFTTEKAELEVFIKSYPQYDHVLKGLLRSYEGIFNYVCSIDESKLARFISEKKDKVVADLTEINQMGMIEYTSQKEKPRIKFLLDRVNTSDLIINQKNILKRRKAFEKRLNAILRYVKNQHSCRSKMMATYFNDHNPKRCGVCDNCLRENSIIITKEEFEEIQVGIKTSINKKPVNSAQLINQLSDFKTNKIWKVLRFLQEENIVSVNEDGFIYMKGPVQK